MLHKIPQVLNPEELNAVRRVLEQSEFVDGKLTAGVGAGNVKFNEELGRDTPQKEPLAQIIIGALYRKQLFQQVAMPAKVSTPLFARYTKGMSYGIHIDEPIMGDGPFYRTDLSFTVFLTDPDEYEGGELTIQTPYSEQQTKLKAGDAVLYPSGSLHRVAEVTSGVRMVAVGWVQSMVRDPAQRELLYDLARAREKLVLNHPEEEETHLVDHALINLTRMWSDV